MLAPLLEEARKIIRASSARTTSKDWDRRTTAALGVARKLVGTKALVLYFGSDQDREEFTALIKQAKPNLKAVNL